MSTKKADLIIDSTNAPEGSFNAKLEYTGIEFVINLYGRIDMGRIKQHTPSEIVGVMNRDSRFTVNKILDQVENIEREDILFNKLIKDLKYIPKVQRKYNISDKYLLYKHSKTLNPLIIIPQYSIVYDVLSEVDGTNIRFTCVESESNRYIPDIQYNNSDQTFKRKSEDEIQLESNGILSRFRSSENKIFDLREPYNNNKKFKLVDVYTDFSNPYVENYKSEIYKDNNKIIIKVLTDVPTYFKFNLNNKQKVHRLCSMLEVNKLDNIDYKSKKSASIKRINKNKQWSSESGNYQLIDIEEF